MSIRTMPLLAVPLLFFASTTACAHSHTVPGALAGARAACARVLVGPVRDLEPAASGDAEAACAEAEAADRQGSRRAEPLAMVAESKARLAESLAATAIARREARDAFASRELLLQLRAEEARAIAEHDAESAPPKGVAEMQPTAERPMQPKQPASPAQAPR